MTVRVLLTENIRIHVVSCDKDTRLLLEKVAECNGISLKNYTFTEHSLYDGMFSS